MAGLAPAAWESAAVWSLGIALKGLAVLLAALVAAAASRRASAGLRHFVWSGAVAALLLLPLVSLSVPWRVPVLPLPLRGAAQAAAPAAHLFLAEGSGASHAVGAVAAAPSRSAADGGVGSSGALVPWLLAVWAAGTACYVALLGLGAVSLRRVVRRAKPLDTPDWTRPLVEGADRLGLARLPRLSRSDRVAMPVVCGLLSPHVVLPDSSCEWSDGRRRAVLFHELAHLRRLDLPVNLVSRLACALYWFNPLVWLAARRIRTEGERASDDLVLRAGARPSEYADHLLQIVCGARHALAPAVAIPMAQPREFEGRMLAILDEGAPREQPSRRQTGALAALAAALLVPIAALAPARAAPAPGTPATAAQMTVADAATGPAPAPAAPADGDSASTPRSRADGRLERQLRVTERVGPMLAALLGALEGPEAAGRLDAARALGAVGAPAAVPALGERLLRDRDPEVRRVSAWAIGQAGSSEGTRFLGAAVRRDSSAEVRAAAVEALGRIADPASAPALEAALGDASDDIRAMAAWGLGTVRPPSAPPALIAALSDPVRSVVEQACWAAGQIRDPSAVPRLAVLSRERDPHFKVGLEALWALARIGGEAARPALSEALRIGHLDPELQAAITAALAGRVVPVEPRSWHGRPPL